MRYALLFFSAQTVVKPESLMIKRIEFTLNLEDPREARIFHALKPSLRYRRGGAVIRQALGNYLIAEKQEAFVTEDSQEKVADEQA